MLDDIIRFSNVPKPDVTLGESERESEKEMERSREEEENIIEI